MNKNVERHIRVVTDAGSDIPDVWRERYGIGVVPAAVTSEGKSYTGISIADYKELLRNAKEIPKTSVLGTPDFLKVYDEDDSDLMAVHLGSGFSGMYQTGVSASREINRTRNPERKAAVYDSRTASLGLAAMAVRAAQKAEKGDSLEMIVSDLDEMAGRISIVFTVKDMNHLRKSGRVSYLTGMLGSILKICPVLELGDNKVGIIADKIRTRGRAINELKGFIEKFGSLEQAGVLHFGAQSEAEDLQKYLMGLRIKNREVVVKEIGPVVATHGGIGTLGVFLERKR